MRLLVAATAVTSVGDGLSAVGFPLLAVGLTSNPLLIVGLAVAGRLPWLLTALPAGAIVDRVDRRRLVVGIELGRAVGLALLAATVVTGHSSILALYIAAFVVGVGETFVSAATRSVIPLLVEPPEVPGANGYVFAAETAGERFAGPAVGGLLFASLSALPLIGDALSYLASGALLRRVIPRSPGATDAASSSVAADVRNGLRWFWSNRPLRTLAAVVTSFAFCQSMVLAVLVLYATRTLRLGTTDYGAFLAVAAIGDVVAGLVAGRIYNRLGPTRTILTAGLVTGACYAALSATSSAYLAVAALAAEAAASTLGNVATLSLRHAVIPRERFGLVNNAFRMCVVGVIPVGALVGGAAAATVGVPRTFLVAGVLQSILLLAVARPLLRLVRVTATTGARRRR